MDDYIGPQIKLTEALQRHVGDPSTHAESVVDAVAWSSTVDPSTMPDYINNSTAAFWMDTPLSWVDMWTWIGLVAIAGIMTFRPHLVVASYWLPGAWILTHTGVLVGLMVWSPVTCVLICCVCGMTWLWYVRQRVLERRRICNVYTGHAYDGFGRDDEMGRRDSDMYDVEWVQTTVDTLKTCRLMTEVTTGTAMFVFVTVIRFAAGRSWGFYFVGIFYLTTHMIVESIPMQVADLTCFINSLQLARALTLTMPSFDVVWSQSFGAGLTQGHSLMQSTATWIMNTRGLVTVPTVPWTWIMLYSLNCIVSSNCRRQRLHSRLSLAVPIIVAYTLGGAHLWAFARLCESLVVSTLGLVQHHPGFIVGQTRFALATRDIDPNPVISLLSGTIACAVAWCVL